MAGVTGGVTGGAFTVKGAGGGVALAYARAACCSACSRSARVHGSSSWFRCQPRLALGCRDGWPGVINTDDDFSWRSGMSPG